jgi:enamine deaminase RidA (YjgF/YER057c/UK114 family)
MPTSNPNLSDEDRSRDAASPSAEFSVTVRALPAEPIPALVGRFASLLKDRDATVLLLMCYGAISARDETVRVLRRYLGAIDWPILWVEGGSCDGAPLSGFQAYALQGARDNLQRIVIGGRVVATVYEDGDARHCLVGGLGPISPDAGPSLQADQTFGNLEMALGQAGFSLSDVARTWFYNDNLLGWYNDFNRVRTSYYSRRSFRIGSMPASTAVGARNPFGTALALGAWAVKPLTAECQVREVGSPLQCPAPAYGSSFSRAMELISGKRQRLLISGTASIEPGGKTVHLGDPRRQIELTMDVVAAMLHSRELAFSDTTRALAYFKDPSYAPLFQEWLLRHGLKGFPYLPVHCEICRDDLLWEIELDACSSLS